MYQICQSTTKTVPAQTNTQMDRMHVSSDCDPVVPIWQRPRIQDSPKVSHLCIGKLCATSWNHTGNGLFNYSIQILVEAAEISQHQRLRNSGAICTCRLQVCVGVILQHKSLESVYSISELHVYMIWTLQNTVADTWFGCIPIRFCN